MANFHDVQCPSCRRESTIPSYQVNTTVAECEHCKSALYPGLRRASAAAAAHGIAPGQAQASPTFTGAHGPAIVPDTKYGAVRALCLLHNIFGGLCVLVGVVFLLAGVGAVVNPPEPYLAKSASQGMTVAIRFGAGIGLMVAGLTQLAAAQVLRIFMDQEEHQQVMRGMLHRLLQQQSE